MYQQITVETPSPQVAAQEEKRTLVRDIMGGTNTMRAGGETWLPKHPAEGSAVYRSRLKKTFLDNFVDLAITKAVGKLFSKPIQRTDILPEIEPLLENIDRQGSALDPFVMDVARQAFQDGISFVMVDMPQVGVDVRTLADEKRLGIRPYAIHIRPQDILETLSEMIAGVETLTRVRIKECVSVPAAGSWRYEEIEQVRVWYRDEIYDVNTKQSRVIVRWEVWREVEDINDADKFALVDEGTTAFNRIQLIPFYTNRTGYMAGEPPFQNIAESTLEHWQWKSEHAHALTMCCFGMLTATGVSPEDQIEVGPAKVLRAADPAAQFGYTETTGVGVTLAANALKEIEARIETAGVNLRVERAGGVTATAAAIDSEDTSAGLKAIAHGFSDSIGLMLQYFAEIMGLDADNAGTVAVNTDFGAAKGTLGGLPEITKGRALGDISRRAWINTMKWRGELDPDFDIEANEDELDQESPALASFPAQANKDLGNMSISATADMPIDSDGR